MKHMTRAMTTFVLVFLVSTMTFIACTGNKRQDTLRASLAVMNGARDGFKAWDAAHQKAIVDGATSKEDATAKIAAYRVKQAELVLVIEAAYHALAQAALKSDDPSLKEALARATELVAAVKAFTSP